MIEPEAQHSVEYQIRIVEHGPPLRDEIHASTHDPHEAAELLILTCCGPDAIDPESRVDLTVSLDGGPPLYAYHDDSVLSFRTGRFGEVLDLDLTPTHFDARTRFSPECGPQGEPDLRPIPTAETTAETRAADLIRNTAQRGQHAAEHLLDALHGRLPEGLRFVSSVSEVVRHPDGSTSSRHANMDADGPDVRLSDRPGDGPPAAAARIMADLAAAGMPVPERWMDPDEWSRVEESIPRSTSDRIAGWDAAHAAPEPVDGCPFCMPTTDDRVVCTNRTCIAIHSTHPVSPGHSLVIPKRHVPDWFQLEPDEIQDCVDLLFRMRGNLLAATTPPDGFNVGINCGAAAGQTVMHVHVHLIPRWTGDTPDPRGGVRGVIPGRMHYPVDGSEDELAR